ncbi:hypothetical protein BDY19DRAFT_894380 [Irpex rosettiformis]|uniref:Uncharacterized protein n=1 Tax=Irpex rosettiformis TaxID=378272 RepID=A0ACB8TX44_9APHY|nr:hypothetical protein BDY19DRAFT_894380 [Irpex rosettiformis]
MNDKDSNLIGARGVANPTISNTHSDPLAANFVIDPATDEIGVGVSDRLDGGRQAQRNFKETASVVEGRPGIIESTNIDPLNENSNKDDGWANAHSTGSSGGIGPTAKTTASTASATARFSTGTAKFACGHAMGDQTTKQAGAEVSEKGAALE